MKYIIDKFKADLILAYLEKCKLYMTNIISAGNPLGSKEGRGLQLCSYIKTRL